jgi:glutamate synthase (NADPH/NADH) small chain
VGFILGIGGIEVRNNVRLGRDVRLADLRQEYDAVFLGLGHNGVNRLRLAAEDAAGVHNAVDYIARIRQEDLAALPVGRRVVVVGGGNTAIDIAVQIKKLGAEYVTLVYRRGPVQMSATAYEQEVAQTNGVLIKTWARPSTLEADDEGITAVTFEYTRDNGEGGAEGTGEFFTLEADQVFKAIGQGFDPAALETEDLPAIEDGRIRVDAERRTSLPDVWAGGDCVAGRDLTVVAVQDGKLAAESIDRTLMGAAPAS